MIVISSNWIISPSLGLKKHGDLFWKKNVLFLVGGEMNPSFDPQKKMLFHEWMGWLNYQLGTWLPTTVDGWYPVNSPVEVGSWNPMIYRDSAPSQVVGNGISAINSSTWPRLFRDLNSLKGLEVGDIDLTNDPQTWIPSLKLSNTTLMATRNSR